MKISAHEKNFGFTDDEPFYNFVWTRDVDQDFVFSLLRMKDENKIEIMIIDQVLERVEELKCTLSHNEIRAEIPTALQKHLKGKKEIVVEHHCKGQEYIKLIETMNEIFKNKENFKIIETT